MYRIIFITLIALLFACTTTRRPDGWYAVTESNHIEGKAIINASDFEVVSLDTTSRPGSAFIVGKSKTEAVSKWADATEQRIGKRIGFVYKDSVITAPTVHCRIESGTFTIENDNRELILEIYRSLTH